MVLIVPVMHIWRDCNQNCTAIHWVPQLMYCTVPVHCSRCCTCDAYMMRLYPELYSYPRGPPTSAPRLPLWPGATHYTHHNNNKNQLWGEWGGGGEKQVFFLTVCLYIFFLNSFTSPDFNFSKYLRCETLKSMKMYQYHAGIFLLLL